MNKKIKLLFLSLTVILVFFYLLALVYKMPANADLYTLVMTKYYSNNPEKKMYYYEEAFKKGHHAQPYRDDYCNILLQLNLDAEIQQKLVNFISIPINDSAKMNAETAINNLRDFANEKFPNNYISQASYNKKILRWADMPIKFGFEFSQSIPDYYIEEIEQAFSTWAKSTNYKLYFERDDRNSNIIIKFNPNPSNENKESKYIIAYTNPEINNDNLKSITIEFFLKDADNEYFSKNQIYNTALHEIGHAIGFMGHCKNLRNIMSVSMDSVNVANDLRATLTESDINTIKFLYSIKPDITNSKKVYGDYVPYIALGGDDEIAKSKLSEAKSYIINAPNIANGYIDMAEGFVAKKEYEKARKCLLISLRYPASSDVTEMINYNLVVVNYYLSNYDEALSYIEKLDKYSKEESIKYLQAKIYKEKGDIQKSVNIYASLISEDPSNIEYVIELVNIYVENRRLLAARKVLKNFVNHNPNERNNPRFNSYGVLKFNL